MAGEQKTHVEMGVDITPEKDGGVRKEVSLAILYLLKPCYILYLT